MHKLIIASSTTLQISATLHKLLPVHPTGYMLRVQIFDVGETVDRQTVCGAYWDGVLDRDLFTSIGMGY